jgi:hypothetical protein
VLEVVLGLDTAAGVPGVRDTAARTETSPEGSSRARTGGKGRRGRLTPREMEGLVYRG